MMNGIEGDRWGRGGESGIDEKWSFGERMERQGQQYED
jgi:hypothetical protein